MAVRSGLWFGRDPRIWVPSPSLLCPAIPGGDTRCREAVRGRWQASEPIGGVGAVSRPAARRGEKYGARIPQLAWPPGVATKA